MDSIDWHLFRMIRQLEENAEGGSSLEYGRQREALQQCLGKDAVELVELDSTNYTMAEAQIVRLHELRAEQHIAEETSSTLEAPSAQEAAHTDSVQAERREVSGLSGEHVFVR